MTLVRTTRSTFVGGLHVVEHQPPERVFEPVVLLLHGIGGSARSCVSLASELADRGVQAWCLDAAGYGKSADPGADHDAVADVLRVADEISPEHPLVLLGTSWGGVVALATALARPERIAGLVLADSTRGSGTTPDRAEAMRVRSRDMAERGSAVVAAERAPRLLAPGADPEIAEAVRASMTALRHSGFAAAAEFMASTDHGPRLAEIVCPTLVLVGEHDVVTGVNESHLLAESIPGAQFHSISDAGHVAIQEQPAAAAALVTDFLEHLT